MFDGVGVLEPPFEGEGVAGRIEDRDAPESPVVAGLGSGGPGGEGVDVIGIADLAEGGLGRIAEFAGLAGGGAELNGIPLGAEGSYLFAEGAFDRFGGVLGCVVKELVFFEEDLLGEAERAGGRGEAGDDFLQEGSGFGKGEFAGGTGGAGGDGEGEVVLRRGGEGEEAEGDVAEVVLFRGGIEGGGRGVRVFGVGIGLDPGGAETLGEGLFEEEVDEVDRGLTVTVAVEGEGEGDLPESLRVVEEHAALGIAQGKPAGAGVAGVVGVAAHHAIGAIGEAASAEVIEPPDDVGELTGIAVGDGAEAEVGRGWIKEVGAEVDAVVPALAIGEVGALGIKAEEVLGLARGERDGGDLGGGSRLAVIKGDLKIGRELRGKIRLNEGQGGGLGFRRPKAGGKFGGEGIARKVGGSFSEAGGTKNHEQQGLPWRASDHGRSFLSPNPAKSEPKHAHLNLRAGCRGFDSAESPFGMYGLFLPP